MAKSESLLEAAPATASPHEAKTPPLVVARHPARIPIAGPWITRHEVEAVGRAVAESWYSRAGSSVARFERAFAERLGVAHAIALPSCTSAIHLALAALGVGPGDEVIVPDLTWIATAAPVDYVGALPVFADVDASTWCLCPDSVEALITERTRAIVAVDLYGNIPDYERLAALARGRGIALIEDAAEAVGTSSRGTLAGAFGDVGCFSFHGTKTLTTGEGGMLVTNDARLHSRCRFLADHGREPGDKSFANREVAFKYRMSDLQAALGAAQLDRLDELVAKKRRIHEWYAEALRGLPYGAQLNTPGALVESSYWMTTLVLHAGTIELRDQVMAELRDADIDSRPFFLPLSAIPAFRDRDGSAAARARNRNAQAIGPRGLNLPSALVLERADVERVAEVVVATLRSCEHG